ncbi:hypothetical protein D3C76_248520 [compost metagenome]
MREKRILWLLNHDTLSKFELPLIRDLGFEIFTPKITVKEILQASGSITFDYDYTLTIPEDDLKLLNQYDFTSVYDMPLQIKNLVNKYFATAITYTDTSFSILTKLLHNFEGNILFRAFGVGPSRFNSYSELIDHYFSSSDKFKLQQVSDRFWFSQCYPNLAEIEEDIYRDKAVYMPLGLPLDFYEIEDQWSGDMDKLLFFCTRIKYVAESEQVYNQFKSDFKGFDYVIAGNQPVPVDDERVTGFLERNELNDLYKKCKVMYYHSTNPRHLHYHPLEAMIAGMPVIYMDGSLLSILGGERQSGCCKDIKEARNKVQRIIEGDSELINNIICDQKEILTKFSYEFNRRTWENNFLPIVQNENSIRVETPKNVAVFLADQEERCHIDDYIELIQMLYQGAKSAHVQNKLMLNVYKDHFDLQDDLAVLTEAGVAVREYAMKTLTAKETLDSLSLMFKNKPSWLTNYMLPVDYARNNVDADIWLFLDNQMEAPIAPIKPYGIFIENIGDRYYETLSATRISNIKNASFILTFSQEVRKDIEKHLGIKKEKIYLIPFTYSQINLSREVNYKGDFVLLELDLKKPSLITKFINDIYDYYRIVGKSTQIKIYFNNYLKEHNGHIIDDLTKFIQSSEILKNNVFLYVDLDRNSYDALYAYAKKVIIPQNTENIFFKMAKATLFAKPIVLGDFYFYKEIEKMLDNPIIRYNNFQLNKNVLIETIENEIEIEGLVKVIEGKEMLDNIEEVANVWRKLL